MTTHRKSARVRHSVSARLGIWCLQALKAWLSPEVEPSVSLDTETISGRTAPWKCPYFQWTCTGCELRMVVDGGCPLWRRIRHNAARRPLAANVWSAAGRSQAVTSETSLTRALSLMKSIPYCQPSWPYMNGWFGWVISKGWLTAMCL